MKFDRRISRRSFLAAAGVTSAALALTACGGSSSSTAASSAASGASSAAAGTAQGGTLNIMLETEVQSLDPQVATDGTSFEVIADYTDGLMQMDADGAAVPALAETYDISEDGKTYTFHLRDAKWSNGEAVTAADFVFGWQRAVDPATASEYSYMLSDIGQVVNAAEIIAGEKPVTDLGVTAVDDKTLEVQLNVPVSYFLSLMYFPTFYPVNEAFYNTCADTFGTSPETVLSNGAFVLTDYQPAATAFALEKNPDYYDADKIALDGLAYVDHEVEGPHALIGADLAKKYNESKEILHAIAAHHEDQRPETALAVLVQAADSLSGARPGARKELLESYVKRLEDLENIASEFDGVSKAYAIQAGREIRVMVNSENVDDDQTYMLCKGITGKIEENLTYPGQIRVTVIRERRAVGYAK